MSIFTRLTVIIGAFILGSTVVIALPASSEPVNKSCLGIDVDVVWSGKVVESVTVNSTPHPGVAPRAVVQLLGEDNRSLYFEQVTGENPFTLYPGIEAEVVIAESGWRPAALCYFEEAAPIVETPTHTPGPLPSGDYIDDDVPVIDPANTDVVRTLHSQ